jgi:hypothetical protein
MWHDVEAELDAWMRARRVCTFWWRDDDAVDVTPRREALLSLANRHDVPVALSVIPSLFATALPRRLKHERLVDVLVHGHSHVNHAPAGQQKREYCGRRRLCDMEQELCLSLEMISKGFGRQALPVLVPPWNRIPPRLVDRLAALGYRGLSTWKPRRPGLLQRGLQIINTHLDPIDWRGGRAPKSEHAVAADVLRKLRWRRANPERAQEPLGLLTHHLLWGPELEQIISNLLVHTRRHPAVRWVSARHAFGL